MAFCTKCGVEVSDAVNFCPACGSPREATPGGQQTGAQQQYSGYQQQQYNNNQQPPYGQQPYGGPVNDVEANKGISVLCYLGLLLLIPLLTRPDSEFVKYHSNQGLVLLLFCIALGVVGWIPIIGWLVSSVGSLFAVVCLIMGIINVLNGDCKELPLIGQIKILK